MIQSYPLQWPVGYERSRKTERSRYDVKSKSGYRTSISMHVALQGLLKELKALGATDWVVSTNVPVRKDGLPYSNHRNPEDTGVAVYFQLKKESMVFACDKWNRTACNVRAIAKTIERLRGLERDGVSDMLNRAFTGFKALPAGGDVAGSVQTFWQVLGVPVGSDKKTIKKAYYDQVALCHPDSYTPDADKFRILAAAYQQAQYYLKNNK